jgi:hypothetical protein
MFTDRTRLTKFALLTVVVLATAGCANVRTQPVVQEDLNTNYAEVSLFADSYNPISRDRIEGFRLLTGKLPVYWGRYICNGDHPDADMIDSELETFRATGIQPILILAPHQWVLSEDATAAHAITACFARRFDELNTHLQGYSLPDDVLVVLDVETKSTLSGAFLNALVTDLQRDGVLVGGRRFGIYLSGAYSRETREVINDAIAHNLPITVAWFDRYLTSHPCAPMPFWQENNIGELGKLNVETELWQYAEACHGWGAPYQNAAGFDLNAIKPRVYSAPVPVAILPPGIGDKFRAKPYSSALTTG